MKNTDESGENNHPPSSEFANLTDFQRDILFILSEGSKYKGLGIKEELEKYYAKEINHGRLYPNLDTLAEKGFIEKTALNKRSNGYSISELGEAHITSRRRWKTNLIEWLAAPSEEPTKHRDKSTPSDENESDQTTDDNDNIAPSPRGETTKQDQEKSEETDRQPESDNILNKIVSEFEELDDS